MTTFSKTGFKALNYNSFRPHYPPSFYTILENYIREKSQDRVKALDLGCGSGVATYPLLNIADDVIGLDLSDKMVDAANSLKKERLDQLGISDTSLIKFESGSAEQYVKNHQSSKGTFGLITAAQCIHWFQNYPDFFASCAALLNPGGVLAYWYYLDPVITEYSGSDQVSGEEKSKVLEKATSIYNKYVYDDKRYLGPHWEQPGRNILKNELVEVDKNIPRDLYSDIVVNKYRLGSDAGPNDLDLSKRDITLKDLRNYLTTYSSYHNFKEATGDEVGLISLYINELKDSLNWDDSTKIDLVWKSGYTLMRKT